MQPYWETAAFSQPAVLVAGRSNAWLLFWTAPFWFLLLYGSFVPATLNPWLEIAGVPVDSFDVLMTVTAAFYVLLFLNTPAQPRAARWNRGLPLCTAAILAYAAISFLWNGLDGTERIGMAVSLVVAAATLVLAYFLILYLPAEQLNSFLLLLCGTLAVIGLAYSAESFLGLNLRSELGRSYSVGFGIDRVHGPLFASSRGHLILLPAIAYVLQSLLVDRSRRLLKTAILLSLVLTCLGLGSRAALILLFAFGLVLCWAARTRMSGLFLFLGILAISAGFVFSAASGERLQSMVDSDRLTTHLTAWDTIKGRDLSRDLSGSGYGSIWHWYVEDVTLGDKILHGWLMRSTPYGATLYNPHSLPLLLIVELGFLGLLYLVKIGAEMGRLLWRGLRRGPAGIFACGVALSTLAFFAEVVIFKEPKTSGIWLIFLFAALKTEPAR